MKLFIFVICLGNVFYHVGALIIMFFMGKLFMGSRIGMARMIGAPNQTMKTVGKAGISAMRHIGWACGCGIIMAILLR